MNRKIYSFRSTPKEKFFSKKNSFLHIFLVILTGKQKQNLLEKCRERSDNYFLLVYSKR